MTGTDQGRTHQGAALFFGLTVARFQRPVVCITRLQSLRNLRENPWFYGDAMPRLRHPAWLQTSHRPWTVARPQPVDGGRMRRQDIQLLAQARQGDLTARCEVGRRYLLGVQGFQRHVATGLEYLLHTSLAGQPAPAVIMAESLPLHELLQLALPDVLARAAAAGSVAAQLKFGVSCVLRPDGLAEGKRWLAAAALAGDEGARRAREALAGARREDAVLAVLRPLAARPDIDAPAIALLAARQALGAGELRHLSDCLRAALALGGALGAELATLVVAAVRLADATGQTLHGVPDEALRISLEQRASQGDKEAAFTLGRALCGLACPALPDDVFVAHQNMRKGAAFLMRAADAGCDAAWLCLYRLHADHRLSVANPQMARFFLEKAAGRGQVEALRKLGALRLREASGLADSEQAIQWLHQAAEQGDVHATTLLQSLVLPVGGGEDEANLAIEQLRASDPWLAMRLSLARAYGLTKLEALCVDPVDGLRPWGLVVGKNPFIAQVRLSAPRAVPATTARALAVAQRAAAFFGQSRGDSGAAEGDLRARSLRQRRLFERLGLDEAMFFADASSMTLEALRLGAKWAYRAREPLSLALAA
jgi:hypothetical protein